MSSNNIETRIFRDRDGWNATSELDLAGEQLLKIRTYKNDRGILAAVEAHYVEYPAKPAFA